MSSPSRGMIASFRLQCGTSGYLKCLWTVCVLKFWCLAYTIPLVLTFCINSTRGRRWHEPRRWLGALVKETGNPTVTFGSPLTTLSSVSRTRCRNSVAGLAEPALALTGHTPTYVKKQSRRRTGRPTRLSAYGPGHNPRLGRTGGNHTGHNPTSAAESPPKSPP
jgi:hypothetical protein